MEQGFGCPSEIPQGFGRIGPIQISDGAHSGSLYLSEVPIQVGQNLAV